MSNGYRPWERPSNDNGIISTILITAIFGICFYVLLLAAVDRQDYMQDRYKEPYQVTQQK